MNSSNPLHVQITTEINVECEESIAVHCFTTQPNGQWVGMYYPYSPDNKYLNYYYITNPQDTLIFKVPVTFGKVEFRAIKNWQQTGIRIAQVLVYTRNEG